MSGSVEGGKKAAKTNKERNGEDFYARIGSKGGQKSCNGGFASDKVGKDGLTGRERARLVGAKGGRKSRRTSVKNGQAKKAEEKAEARAEGRMFGLLNKVFGNKNNAN